MSEDCVWNFFRSRGRTVILLFSLPQSFLRHMPHRKDCRRHSATSQSGTCSTILCFSTYDHGINIKFFIVIYMSPKTANVPLSFYYKFHFTVTVTVYDFVPDFTVIFAFPAFTPLITPFELTVAILVLLLL